MRRLRRLRAAARALTDILRPELMILIETEAGGHAAAPIEMLEQYFSGQGWSYDRHGDEEIVAQVDAAWGQFELRGLWRDDDRVLQFVALPGLKVEAGERGQAYELIGLINEGLWLGHFDLWSNDGQVLFRHAALVGGEEDEPALSGAHAEALVEAALDELDRYYPAFQFLIDEGHGAADALRMALTDTAGEA